MEKIDVHLTGAAHIDPVWLWRWQEGFAEIKATFRSALDRICQFDDFIFTSGCAAYYRWVEENCPAMFEEIRARVAEGRWVIVGGWWIQPDCNIPSGESFARQSLYAQRYFYSRFGRIARTGYNVDSFGHNGNLPQILRQSGMTGYIYMRPDSNREKQYPFPDGLPFSWVGVDGTAIPAYRLPDGYGQSMDAGTFERLSATAEKRGASALPMSLNYGVGNHGGGPTVRTVEYILQKRAEDGPLNFLFSSPDAFFEAVGKKVAAGEVLPVLSGDLQHHASGCYSTHSESKEANRRAENRLLSAEKCGVLCQQLLGVTPGTDRLRDAWERVLFNQFHDIMGGCSIRSAFEDVRESHGYALSAGAEEYNQALQRISWAIDTQQPVTPAGKSDWRLWNAKGLGAPIVVFNPCGHPVLAPVVLNHSHIDRVTDDEGKDLALQRVRGEQTNGEDMFNCLFRVRVPALGYTVCWAYPEAEGKREFDSSLRVTSHSLGNRHLRAVFDPATGDITSLYLKKENLEFARRLSAGLVIDESDCDTWAHGVFSFDRVAGRFKDPRFEVLEKGPVRACLRVETRYEDARLTQDFYLYEDGRDIEVRVTVFWTRRHEMLKLSFDTGLSGTEGVYEIPYGVIRKPADGCEEPAQSFAAAENGQCGLAVLNTGRYSYSCRDGELRLLALRGAGYADHFGFARTNDGTCRFMEQGERDFFYCIRPYAGNFDTAGLSARGQELNAPAVFVPETYHEGPLARQYSGISLSEGIGLGALKCAEDGKGLILRLWETGGKQRRAHIGLPLAGVSFEADFHPFEIRTYRIENGHILPTNLLEGIE